MGEVRRWGPMGAWSEYGVMVSTYTANDFINAAFCSSHSRGHKNLWLYAVPQVRIIYQDKDNITTCLVRGHPGFLFTRRSIIVCKKTQLACLYTPMFSYNILLSSVFLEDFASMPSKTSSHSSSSSSSSFASSSAFSSSSFSGSTFLSSSSSF